MKCKVNLTLDEEILLRAKSLASNSGVSLSCLVENQLKQILDTRSNGKKGMNNSFSTWINNFHKRNNIINNEVSINFEKIEKNKRRSKY